MTSRLIRRYVAVSMSLAVVGSGTATAWSLANAYTTAPVTSLFLLCMAFWMAAGFGAAKFLPHWPRRHLLEAGDVCNALQDAKTGLIIASLSGRILAANRVMAEFFHRNADELCHAALSSLMGDEFWTSLVDEREAAAEGKTVNLELDVACDNGATRTLTGTARVARDAFGKPTYFVLEMNDISDRKAAEQDAKNTSAQLHRVLSKSSDLVLFVDAKLKITYANENAHCVLAPESGTLLNHPVYDFVSTNDRRTFMETLKQFAQHNRNEACIEQLRLTGREKMPVSSHILRLSGPKKNGYAVIFSIMQGQMQTLADAKNSQARFAQVFHASPDAILLVRVSDTLIIDFNEGFSRLLGYSREQAIGEHEHDLKFFANNNERTAISDRLRAKGEVIDHETMLRNAQGILVHVELSMRYVEIDNDLCVLCTGRDITRRISAEAAMVESEEKFEKVFSQSPDGIVIIRLNDGVITDVNNAMIHRSGYERQELIGRSIYGVRKLIDDKDLEIATHDLERGYTITNQDVTFFTKSGDSLPSVISAVVVELSGETFVMVIAKDMSKQHATEERLRGSEQRFRGIFENAPFGIMLVDAQGYIFQANQTASMLLAYDAEEMPGIHISRLVPPEERLGLKDNLQELSSTKRSTSRSERLMLRRNGLEIWTSFHVVLQSNSAGEPLYYIVQIADITDIKRNQQRMEEMAFYDSLTNLANRRLFQDRLEYAIEQCKRNNRSAALLYLDLDNFKRVNDTLGHQVGDHLLREVALRLQHCVRRQDTVGRTGGDEFTILLTEVNAPADAGQVAQKILNHLREPIHVSGHPLIVTTSIGITVIPGDSLDPSVLMRNADLAMYKAKERGRNNYQFYSNDLNTNTIKRLRTEYEIRQALERNEFELFYQPKVALKDNRIIGVESLIRWNHPERGIIGPDEFIEVAEDTGSIIDIGTWVIEEACRACQTLIASQGRPIQVAINISPRQFRDPNLVANMRRSMREAQLNPENIEIEITETMLMHDVEAAQITVERLSELGVSLAIDDFGTGYSSLNYLKRFPINTVKVDRSFVTDLPFNTDDMAITRAVIAMAHQLKMEVVAEGVETMEQLEFLASQHCEYAQGWLFSKALPLHEVLTLFSEDFDLVQSG